VSREKHPFPKRPQLSHATEIRFSGAQDMTEHGGTVSLNLQLLPHQPVSLSVDVVPIFCGERVALRHGQDAFGDRPIDMTHDAGVQMSAGNQRVQHAWDRAVSDLASLALLEGDGEERLTPAGGVPKYLALFGRDVLVTAFQASLLAPAMLRGSLRHIAQWNATKYDERFDEEPCRVIHQRELGPLSLLEKHPFIHYYGDYSASGLFLIDMAWDLALTGDKEFFLSMQDEMLATLEWMDRDGDGDGDGFYEYETKAGCWGEKNQGWKDSREAVLYEDGRLVKDPIALVEIQGCYYAAKQLLGLAFASLGDGRRAANLLAGAERLKRRFNEKFWMPAKRYFALAVDRAKNLVRTIAADPGQCLAYGIIDDDKAEAVATRLMMPDLFDRLPEVFGGHTRDRPHPHPGIYPDANSPQAWSAGAVVLLIHSMLGLIPVAPRQTLIIDPELPDWPPELSLSNIRCGNARVSLRFWRDTTGSTQHGVVDRQGELRIHRPLARDTGVDRFARCLREVAWR
jgi:glycogen debranching enzyme